MLIYDWDSSKFINEATPPKELTYPHGYWNDVANQRAFMNDLAKKLNITNKEEWYKVSEKFIRDHDGYGLLQKYGSSPSKLLAAVYPEYHTIMWMSLHIRYPWDGTKFPKLPGRHWGDVSRQREFMDNLASILNITVIIMEILHKSHQVFSNSIRMWKGGTKLLTNAFENMVDVDYWTDMMAPSPNYYALSILNTRNLAEISSSVSYKT